MDNVNYLELDQDFIKIVRDGLRSNPARTLALFRDEEVFRTYMEAYYLDRGYQNKGKVFVLRAGCWLVQISGEHSLFGPKVETMYVMHVGTIGIHSTLILFNEKFSLCEMAYSLLPETDFTILSGGTLKYQEIERLKEGDYDVDYLLASKFVTLPKKRKLSIRTLNKVDTGRLLPGVPMEYVPTQVKSSNASTQKPATSKAEAPKPTATKIESPKPAASKAESPRPTTSATGAPKGESADIASLRKKYEGKSDEELKSLLSKNYTSDLFKAARMMNSPVGNAMDVFDWPQDKKIDLLAYLELVK